MPRTSLLHSRALPPAKVIGELEVRWCRSVVWLGQDSDSDSFNEHTAKMVEVKHIVFMHADRSACRPTQRPCINPPQCSEFRSLIAIGMKQWGCVGVPVERSRENSSRRSLAPRPSSSVHRYHCEDGTLLLVAHQTGEGSQDVMLYM